MTENPEDLYPADEDRPAPVEDVPFDPDEGSDEKVEVSKQELTDLGEFLAAMQAVILNLQERLLAIETFLSEVFGGATEQEPEVGSETGEGEGEDRESNVTPLHSVDDPGDESHTGGA